MDIILVLGVFGKEGGGEGGRGRGEGGRGWFGVWEMDFVFIFYSFSFFFCLFLFLFLFWNSFSPHNESVIASASYDMTVCLWDIVKVSIHEFIYPFHILFFFTHFFYYYFSFYSTNNSLTSPSLLDATNILNSQLG